MAGLADACSSADDYAHPYRWSGLASVCPGLQHQSFFSAADHLLDHSRNPPPHSLAVASPSSVAWRFASRGRCSDDFAPGVLHRLAGMLLYLPLPAGDYRREHFVLAPRRVSPHCGLLSAPCRDDHAGILGKDPADLLEPAHGGEPSHLAGHEPPGLFCRGLSSKPASPVPPEEGRGAGREARGTSQPSGLYRRHHSLHAWRPDYHRSGGTHSAAESYWRGNSRTSLC